MTPPDVRASVAEKRLVLLGWLATAAAVAMYVSLLDQIALNMAGHGGSLVLPIATVVNSALWLAYGWNRPVKEMPIVIANIPGVVLGIICAVTAFMAR